MPNMTKECWLRANEPDCGVLRYVLPTSGAHHGGVVVHSMHAGRLEDQVQEWGVIDISYLLTSARQDSMQLIGWQRCAL